MYVLQKISQEPVFFLFKKMWQHAARRRYFIVACLSMSTTANLLLLTEPLILAALLNEIQNNGLGEHNITYIILIILSFLLVELAFWVFHGPARVMEKISAFHIERNYRQYLLQGTLGLNMSWHSGRDSGNTIDKINKATDGLLHFSERTYAVVEVLVKAIGTTLILMMFNVYIGIIALVLLIIAFTIIFQFDIRLIPQYKKLNIFENKISARIYDVLSNITTIKVLHIENPVFKNIYKALWAPYKLMRNNTILVEIKWFTGSLLFTLLVVLPLLFYVLYSFHNNVMIEIGTISALYLYLSRLIDVYFTFAGQYDDVIVNKMRILNAEEVEKSFITQKKDTRKNLPRWKNIKLSDIFFSYEDAGTNLVHLDDITFSFSRGEKIACIGESGSGKTTFLKVLHGMYPNTQATIQFDDSSHRKTNFSDIDLQTTLVPQEPEIFSSNIRENITLGVEYSEKEISRATNLAEFTQVISLLPHKLESVINEKGVNLSGGQKQRLALARALLFANKKDIILLDESTSSVDPETEVKIYSNIFKHFEGKTIIASVHKMNLLKYFDRIVIFSDGKIIGDDTFNNLLQTNKQFKKDWIEYTAQHTSYSSN